MTAVFVLIGRTFYFAGYRCPHMTGPGGPLGGCPFCRGEL